MENKVKFLSRIEEVAPEQWNALAVDSAPTLEFEYLHALEKSGSISDNRGYRPAHLALYNDSELVAIGPLYQRDRASVEFGDGGLLEFLSELTGLPFGSGLVGSIPYTPVPGYDFLVASGNDPSPIFASMLEKIDEISMERGLSTSRFYFVAPESPLNRILAEHGYLRLSSPHPRAPEWIIPLRCKASAAEAAEFRQPRVRAAPPRAGASVEPGVKRGSVGWNIAHQPGGKGGRRRQVIQII